MDWADIERDVMMIAANRMTMSVTERDSLSAKYMDAFYLFQDLRNEQESQNGKQ